MGGAVARTVEFAAVAAPDREHHGAIWRLAMEENLVSQNPTLHPLGRRVLRLAEPVGAENSSGALTWSFALARSA